MTEAEILSLASRLGISQPERVARRHFPGEPLLTLKPYTLDFVDVLFESDKAVAVQRGNYISFTTGMEFGPIRTLCGGPAPSGRTLRHFGKSAG